MNGFMELEKVTVCPETRQGGCRRDEVQGALSRSSPSFTHLPARDAVLSRACARRLTAQL